MAEAAATAEWWDNKLPGDLGGEMPSEIPSDGPEHPLGNTGIPNLSSTFTNNPTAVIPGMMQTD